MLNLFLYEYHEFRMRSLTVDHLFVFLSDIAMILENINKKRNPFFGICNSVTIKFFLIFVSSMNIYAQNNSKIWRKHFAYLDSDRH